MLTALDDRVRKLWPALYAFAFFNTFFIRKFLSEICVSVLFRVKHNFLTVGHSKIMFALGGGVWFV